MKLEARWIELTRRNQVKNIFLTKLQTIIIRIADRNPEAADPVDK
jgi:hypothetical protein